MYKHTHTHFRQEFRISSTFSETPTPTQSLLVPLLLLAAQQHNPRSDDDDDYEGDDNDLDTTLQ